MMPQLVAIILTKPGQVQLAYDDAHAGQKLMLMQEDKQAKPIDR